MAAALFYWSGTEWLPISTGDGSGVGPQGPAGADGISINVSGPQPLPPANPRKGDHWLSNAVARDEAGTVELVAAPDLEPEKVLVKQLPQATKDSIEIVQMPTPEPEKILVKRLPPTPAPVIVYLQ
jgi:hypothetical protein